MQNLTLQIFLKSIHFIALIVESVVCDQKFHQMCPPPRVSPDDLQNNDYQNSNIKKVGGINLKQICKINILAHDTGAENFFSKVSRKKPRHRIKKIKEFRRGCHYRSFG